jgi:CMP-N,N'-diacetyllegionaminic acid synthase
VSSPARRPTITGLILARGGSKGIPRKNIVPLAGKPLIAWTIEAGVKSGVLDRLMVSTDDTEIAEVSRAWGAEVPFLRPQELARDETPSMDAVLHALRWLCAEQSYSPECVLLLQPTSPLRQAEDIQNSIALLLEREAACVVSVSQVEQHPYWMKRVAADGRLEEFLPEVAMPTRRQDLPPAYAVNGAIYLGRRDWLMANQSFYGPATYGYIMPPERSLDIDTALDLRLAELALKDKLS